MGQNQSRLQNLVVVAGALLVAVLVFRSCSTGPQRPRTVPVSGSVRYRGNPVADADVAFITPGNARYAIGVTDGQGRFTLGTFMPGDGAIPGTHRVTIGTLRSLSSPLFTGTIPTTKEEFQAYLKSIKDREAMIKAGRTAVPTRYAREETSPLEVTVGPAGGTFDLELTDDIKADTSPPRSP